MDHFSIVAAICRSSMKNPTPALTGHIKRLSKALEKEGMQDQSDSLKGILQAQSLQVEIQPSRVIMSRSALVGEALIPNIKPPVDKESGSYLAEILQPADVKDTTPIFDTGLETSVSSLLEEWKNIDLLKSKGIEPALSLMLFGAPGTGKTLLAHHISAELGYPIVIAKLDGLLSSFLGTTARNISNLFSFANRYKCILLLDEFDAIAKLRDDPNELGELKRVVNTLLQCLDERSKIGFTIAITNHEGLLDPAIWRRFDLRIAIPKPNTMARHQIISNHFKEKLQISSARQEFLAWMTHDFSGSDIEKLIFFLKRRMAILDNEFHFLEAVREFIRLNANMPNYENQKIILTSEEELARHLKSDKSFPQSQQAQLAELFDVKQPTVSKWLNKAKL